MDPNLTFNNNRYYYTCTECRETYPLNKTYFTPDHNSPTHYTTVCRVCQIQPPEVPTSESTPDTPPSPSDQEPEPLTDEQFKSLLNGASPETPPELTPEPTPEPEENSENY
jgi:hypothetical protein